MLGILIVEQDVHDWDLTAPKLVEILGSNCLQRIEVPGIDPAGHRFFLDCSFILDRRFIALHHHYPTVAFSNEFANSNPVHNVCYGAVAHTGVIYVWQQCCIHSRKQNVRWLWHSPVRLCNKICHILCRDFLFFVENSKNNSRCLCEHTSYHVYILHFHPCRIQLPEEEHCKRLHRLEVQRVEVKHFPVRKEQLGCRKACQAHLFHQFAAGFSIYTAHGYLFVHCGSCS
mmetsp:Transcript_5607/g.15689  ORF Transcript_5607/g.15689 Transcript_5607/m.15689 type:complete len:229 (-) Transcript_5607:819-1505(-)